MNPSAPVPKHETELPQKLLGRAFLMPRLGCTPPEPQPPGMQDHPGAAALQTLGHPGLPPAPAARSPSPGARESIHHPLRSESLGLSPLPLGSCSFPGTYQEAQRGEAGAETEEAKRKGRLADLLQGETKSLAIEKTVLTRPHLPLDAHRPHSTYTLHSGFDVL